MFLDIGLTVWAVAMKLSGPWINKLQLEGEKKHYKTLVDDYIPLLTVFIIPYFSYYAYLIVPWVYMYLVGADIYREFVISFGLVNAIASAAFVFLQSGAPRVEVSANTTTGRMLKWHYGLAHPVNAFPSLHVADSLCIAFFLSLVLPEFSLVIWGIAVLISVSTVFTKEHYFLDLAGGVLLAIGVSQLVIYLLGNIDLTSDFFPGSDVLSTVQNFV